MHEHAISIVRTLRESGWQAYLVGGCVRDLLLGREPADYDIATDATPEQVMRSKKSYTAEALRRLLGGPGVLATANSN